MAQRHTISNSPPAPAAEYIKISVSLSTGVGISSSPESSAAFPFSKTTLITTAAVRPLFCKAYVRVCVWTKALVCTYQRTHTHTQRTRTRTRRHRHRQTQTYTRSLPRSGYPHRQFESKNWPCEPRRCPGSLTLSMSPGPPSAQWSPCLGLSLIHI